MSTREVGCICGKEKELEALQQEHSSLLKKYESTHEINKKLKSDCLLLENKV